MNRTQRAIKRHMRELENGRASFKPIYLRCLREDERDSNMTSADRLREELKQMQSEMKKCRKDTRAFSRQITTKEVVEV